MLRPHVGEAVERTDGAGLAVGDVYVGSASMARKGECTPPTFSTANDEDCTHAARDRGDTTATDDPGMESLHHALLTTADNAAADHDVYV